jgi:ribonuclease H, mammalian HI/archaeal HII subfamily
VTEILGIDEAGRGPVIGSMFIGGFLVEESELGRLEELGLKDSKKLSDQARDRLRTEVDAYGETLLREVEAPVLDDKMEEVTINDVELEEFAALISRAQPEKVVIDLPEHDADVYEEKLLSRLDFDPEVTAEHGADAAYPIVSAASVVAKSARERHVERLHEKYGVDFDSGYPHDEATIEFLNGYVRSTGDLPDEARRQWSTSQRILRKARQQDLDGY